MDSMKLVIIKKRNDTVFNYFSIIELCIAVSYSVTAIYLDLSNRSEECKMKSSAVIYVNSCN